MIIHPVESNQGAITLVLTRHEISKQTINEQHDCAVLLSSEISQETQRTMDFETTQGTLYITA
jgi:hypothetical protein